MNTNGMQPKIYFCFTAYASFIIEMQFDTVYSLRTETLTSNSVFWVFVKSFL